MAVNKKNCVKMRNPMNVHGRRRSSRDAGELRKVTEDAFVHILNHVKRIEANKVGIRPVRNDARFAHQSHVHMNGNSNLANVQ